MSENVKTFRSGMTVAAAHTLAELSEEAAAHVSDDQTPREHVDRLLEDELFADVVALLAHVLPRREAVWWAWSCARDVMDSPDPQTVAALESTSKWIVDQTDEQRRAAGDAAESLDYDSPAAMAALAAFMCGDTLGPVDAPPAPPPATGAAQAISGCICMAAAIGDPEGTDDRFRKFIERGMERADKGRIWESASPADAGA
jgi:hypothetical protein